MAPSKGFPEMVEKLSLLVENLNEEIRSNGESLSLTTTKVDQIESRLTELLGRVSQLDRAIRGDDPLGGSSLAMRFHGYATDSAHTHELYKVLEKRVEILEKTETEDRKDKRQARAQLIVAVIAAFAAISAAVITLISGKHP